MARLGRGGADRRAALAAAAEGAGGVIDLPAKNEDGALLQFDQLDARSRLMELGFERIDLRDPEMITVRPKGATSSDAASVAGA